MAVEDHTRAAFGLNHPFNVGLGVPIARQSDDAQGTLAFFFREMQTKDGKPSSRILGVTNKHVACLDTTTDFQLQETDPQYILVCGNRRLALAIDDIEEKAERLPSEMKVYAKSYKSLSIRRSPRICCDVHIAVEVLVRILSAG